MSHPRPRLTFLLTLTLAIVAGSPPEARALRPEEAPPLPPPVGSIQVSTAQGLIDASCALTSGETLELLPGTYDLGTVSPRCGGNWVLLGRPDRPPLSDVAIRGATGNPDDVIITGGGMLDSSTQYGLQVWAATDVLIADLTIRDVSIHAIQIVGDQGAARVRLYHLQIVDTGQQLIKVVGSTSSADDGIVEYSELSYTTGAPTSPDVGFCYTNAISVRGGRNWEIRDNRFREITCQDPAELAGPALLAWGGASGTLVERNTFVNVARGIALGLTPESHTGGVVRNNFIRQRATDLNGAPISIVSADARVLHNSILTHAAYPSAIEARFPSTTGVEIGHNLTDASIWLRDGATATIAENVTDALPGWFVDEASGDLHLTSAARPAVDRVTRLADAVDDFDATPRGAAPGETDIGADEARRAAVPALPVWGWALLAALLVFIAPMLRLTARRGGSASAVAPPPGLRAALSRAAQNETVGRLPHRVSNR